MAAAFGEQAHFSARRDDQLGARAVRRNRLGRHDRLRVDELERGISRDGLHDAAPLHRELLAVREPDDRASATSVGVRAFDALGV
jgi:hypothetical protein